MYSNPALVFSFFFNFRVLLGLLIPKLLPQRRNIKATQLGPLNDRPGLALDRGINHFPVHGPRTLALLLGPPLRDGDAHRPLDFLLSGTENLLGRRHLRRMNALLAVVPHALALETLVLQHLMVGLGAKRRRHQVNRARQIVRSRCCCNHLPRVQELGEARRARDRHVEGEVLRRERQALQQMRRGATDLVEIRERLGGLDQRNHTYGPMLLRELFAARVGEHVADECHVACALDFGDDEGGEVGGFDYFFEVGEGEARAHGVDADGALLDARGERLVQCFAHQRACLSFAAGRHAVFEVVRDAVDRQAARFIEEPLRRARDCDAEGDTCQLDRLLLRDLPRWWTQSLP